LEAGNNIVSVESAFMNDSKQIAGAKVDEG
jgi:hypothetical protein